MSGRGAAGRRSGRADCGLSLVEVLIAVVLLGMAVSAVIPAMLGSVRGSALQDRFAAARRWVVGAGDYTVSSGLARVPCATPADYVAAIRTNAQAHRPAAWSDAQLTVTEVRYWDGTTFSVTCAETPSVQLELQQISLRVVSPDGRVIEDLDVVKSDG